MSKAVSAHQQVKCVAGVRRTLHGAQSVLNSLLLKCNSPLARVQRTALCASNLTSFLSSIGLFTVRWHFFFFFVWVGLLGFSALLTLHRRHRNCIIIFFRTILRRRWSSLSIWLALGSATQVPPNRNLVSNHSKSYLLTVLCHFHSSSPAATDASGTCVSVCVCVCVNIICTVKSGNFTAQKNTARVGCGGKHGRHYMQCNNKYVIKVLFCINS